MNNKTNNARTSSQNLIILFVVFLIIATVGYFIITKHNQKSFAELSAVQHLNEEKMETLMVLVAKLGYGEMIHNFKNFIIRGASDYRTSSYPNAFAENIQVLKEAKAHYLSLLPISDYEKQRLAIVEKTFLEYEAQMEKAKQLKAQGYSISEIDRKVVVDDHPAMQALNEIQSYIVADTQKATDNQTAKAANTLLVELAVVMFALLAEMVIAFEWLINRQIIKPLHLAHCKSLISDHITLSMGAIHCLADDCEDMDSLYKAADELLFQAKEQGRNRVLIKGT